MIKYDYIVKHHIVVGHYDTGIKYVVLRNSLQQSRFYFVVISKDRHVYEANVDCVGHSRKSRNVGIHVFNYLQSRAAMNPKSNAFFILLHNFHSNQVSLLSIFNYFLWTARRNTLRPLYEFLVNITLYKRKLKRNNIVFIWVNWLWKNPVTKQRYNIQK